MFTINSKVEQFGIGDKKRKYVVITTDFENAKKLFSAERYRCDTGAGEQRELVMAHVKTIRKEIEDGNFTPTSVTAGLKSEQGRVVPGENGIPETFQLDVPDNATLSLLDGGHRFHALELLYAYPAYKEDIGKSAITALVMLDGSTKKDFLNLQKGRPVDKSHIHSLSIQEKLLKGKDVEAMTVAYDTAKALNAGEGGVFYNQIRFDSRGVSGIPIASLNSKGASDIATSLVGGAKIAVAAGKSAAWLAGCINLAYATIKKNAPELLEIGMKLTPPPQGTKGSATMIIGLGNMLAYRLFVQGLGETKPEDTDKLVKAAKEVFGTPVNGNFSGPMKRDAMGAFAENYFDDLTEDKKYYGVPLKLVKLLSVSTFSVPKFDKEATPEEPKEPKVPKVKVPKAPKEKKPKAPKKTKQDEIVEDFFVDNSKAEIVTKPEPVKAEENITKSEKAPWEDGDEG